MTLRLPVVYGVTIGDQEIYGTLDEQGNFQEAVDPKSGPRSGLLPLAGDLALELPCRASLVDLNGEPIAFINIGVLHGRIICEGIQALPGEELTGQVLRQAPISRLVREAARGRIVHLRKDFAVRFIQDDSEIPDKPQRRLLSNEFLTQVARIYRNALAAGEPPALMVQNTLGPTTPENARRWVATARKEGFLRASLGQGKRGEDQS